MNGFKVEFSEDRNQVCIIPTPFIPFAEFSALVKIYKKKGYKWWLPADERGGYIFSKIKPVEA
jgi:hypothetical protein